MREFVRPAKESRIDMMQRTILCLLTGLLACGEVVRADHSLKSHYPFLKQYCFECHGAEKQNLARSVADL